MNSTRFVRLGEYFHAVPLYIGTSVTSNEMSRYEAAGLQAPALTLQRSEAHVTVQVVYGMPVPMLSIVVHSLGGLARVQPREMESPPTTVRILMADHTTIQHKVEAGSRHNSKQSTNKIRNI